MTIMAILAIAVFAIMIVMSIVSSRREKAWRETSVAELSKALFGSYGIQASAAQVNTLLDGDEWTVQYQGEPTLIRVVRSVEGDFVILSVAYKTLTPAAEPQR